MKAHAVEASVLFDMLGSTGPWTPGPNDRHGNLLEVGGNEVSVEDAGTPESWLCLSGGTDWQGFQGGFRCISEDGIQPDWLTFRVRIGTPALSGAFLTLAGAQRTWGLEDVVFAFHYSGDERSKQKRCFVVQTGATQHGDSSFPVNLEPEIVADRPYEIAVRFDWAQGKASFFVDGVERVGQMPLKSTRSVRYAAMYNW